MNKIAQRLAYIKYSVSGSCHCYYRFAVWIMFSLMSNAVPKTNVIRAKVQSLDLAAMRPLGTRKIQEGRSSVTVG